ncbi:MAG TPA: GreA/GreB family elongation factor [Candidatus Saccharimonadales bacterium]|nr:GreA/GreB family elongation factor [Candidatus Saccharimonadales bacterium]
MSKAFTKESDEATEPQVLVRLPSVSLPPGARNYMTADGMERMQAELEHLISTKRPRVAALPDQTESKRQLQGLDQRIRDLQASLETAVVPPPREGRQEQVLFGSSVTVRENNGELATYRIVGVDETDLDRDWVSYLSPVARALMNKRAGERVRLKLPGGEKELEIISIDVG